MNIRQGSITDLDLLAGIESRCFPPEQAADRSTLEGRLLSYPQHFLLLCSDEGSAVSFIDGFVTDSRDLTDEMYSRPELHNEQGAWQMIFGLNTLPEHRHKGHASLLMREFLRIHKQVHCQT